MARARSAVRLDAEERRGWLRRLSSWQTPASMRQKVDELARAGVTTGSGTAFVRDAACAARFAELRGADQVRLVFPDPRPDFEIRLGGEVQAFEVTRADPPGRLADLRPTLESIPAMLEAAARRKSDGRYAPHCRLLIHLDAPGRPADELMKSATRIASDFFAEVWVLEEGRLHRTW